MAKILKVRAPFLLGIIDVIAIPRLTLFFGARLLHLGACAAAKACREENKRADNFPAGEYVFHIFLVPDVGNLFSAMSGLGALFFGAISRFSLDYTFSCTLVIMRLMVDLLTRSSRTTSD